MEKNQEFGSNKPQSENQEKKENKLTIIGYELSGLPTYGLDHETGEVARRSYVLYETVYGPKVVTGEWKYLGKLKEEQLDMVKSLIEQDFPVQSTIEYLLVLDGDLVPSVSSDGTPITIRPKGEKWENEARQKWLASMDELMARHEKTNNLATWMENAAKDWRDNHPSATGGELDYHLLQHAKHIRSLGCITEDAKRIAIEAGWSEE